MPTAHQEFYRAAANGHTDTMLELIQDCDDLSGMLTAGRKQWGTDFTPLMAAVSAGQRSAVILMLSLNVSDSVLQAMLGTLDGCKESALHVGAWRYAPWTSSHRDMWNLLLSNRRVDASALLMQKDKDGNTAVAAAAIRGNEGAVRFLLGACDTYGADRAAMLAATNNAGETLLMVTGTVTRNATAVMQLVLDHPDSAGSIAMLAARSSLGKTVLTRAAEVVANEVRCDMELVWGVDEVHFVDPFDTMCVNLLFLLRRYLNDTLPLRYAGVARLGGGQVGQTAYLAEQQHDLAFVVESMKLVIGDIDLDPELKTFGEDEELMAIEGSVRVNAIECVRLLLALGAPVPPGPTVSRILREDYELQKRQLREIEELRRTPHLIDAVCGLAHSYKRQRQQQPQ